MKTSKAIELARAELRAALEEAISLATIPARFGNKAAEVAALFRDLDAVAETQEA
ncbi:MAG TPA: hypothetical protein VJT77_07975 [Burkholderiales bacterium]|nr:hypothetical protein [Burkholderiales bacterium]